MTKELYDKYELCASDDKYINPSLIKAMIKNELHLSIMYDELKEFIKNARVNVSSDQVKGWIKIRIFEKYPHLKHKINSKLKLDTTKDISDDISINIIKNVLNDVPNVINYYENYIMESKIKCSILLEILDDVTAKSDGIQVSDKSKNIFNSLNIKFNDEKNVDYESAINILSEFVTNFKDLYKMLDDANNLDTYVNKSYNKKNYQNNEIKFGRHKLKNYKEFANEYKVIFDNMNYNDLYKKPIKMKEKLLKK